MKTLSVDLREPIKEGKNAVKWTRLTLKAKGGFIDEMIIITLYGHKIAGL
jgi:hypothetical protein